MANLGRFRYGSSCLISLTWGSSFRFHVIAFAVFLRSPWPIVFLPCFFALFSFMKSDFRALLLSRCLLGSRSSFSISFKFLFSERRCIEVFVATERVLIVNLYISWCWPLHQNHNNMAQQITTRQVSLYNFFAQIRDGPGYVAQTAQQLLQAGYREIFAPLSPQPPPIVPGRGALAVLQTQARLLFSRWHWLEKSKDQLKRYQPSSLTATPRVFMTRQPQPIGKVAKFSVPGLTAK